MSYNVTCNTYGSAPPLNFAPYCFKQLQICWSCLNTIIGSQPALAVESISVDQAGYRELPPSIALASDSKNAASIIWLLLRHWIHISASSCYLEWHKDHRLLIYGVFQTGSPILKKTQHHLLFLCGFFLLFFGTCVRNVSQWKKIRFRVFRSLNK